METPLAARDQWIELAKPTPLWTSDALRFESAAGRADSRTDLLLKEIGMGTGTDQAQIVSCGAVNQKPVRLDMSLAITLPDPP